MDSTSDEDYEDLADILSNIPQIRLPLLSKNNPLDFLSEKETMQRFRLCKVSIINLVQLLTDKHLITESLILKTSDISPLLQVLVSLRFYATGSFQIFNGDLHEMSQASVSRIVKQVSKAIAALRPVFIKYPTFQESHVIREEFRSMVNFPGVVGAIDCSHIKIRSPGGQNAELFRNRKGYFSLNVQAVCRTNLQFINCVCRWAGSVHDSRIFDSSLLRAQLGANEVPGILIGDSGYPTLPFLMTPIDKPTTAQERRYNKSFNKGRNVIERAFGVLKRRFHCLGSELKTKLSTTTTIIIACFVLHNYAIQCRDEYDPEDENIDPDQPENEISTHIGNSPSGLATRRTIIENYFQNATSFPICV